jgi:hypothetical protein
MAGSALPLILLGGAALLLMSRGGDDGGDDGDGGDDSVAHDTHGAGSFAVAEVTALTEEEQAKGDWAWSAWIDEPYQMFGARSKTQGEGVAAAKQWIDDPERQSLV